MKTTYRKSNRKNQITFYIVIENNRMKSRGSSKVRITPSLVSETVPRLVLRNALSKYNFSMQWFKQSLNAKKDGYKTKDSTMQGIGDRSKCRTQRTKCHLRIFRVP